MNYINPIKTTGIEYMNYVIKLNEHGSKDVINPVGDYVATFRTWDDAERAIRDLET